MADSLTIFGSAASVISILDVLARATSTLLKMRGQGKDADMSLLSLTHQLVALRAALTKIKEWMESYVDGAHHQLVMDLEASLQCCQILVTRIDSELENLKKEQDRKLSIAAKAKWLLKNGGLMEIQQMVDRQTSTLTLLLTACNSTTLAEQQAILTKPKTRKALENIRKNSESLIVHRDEGSLLTSYTDNLSKLSRVFSFDGELFASKVYHSVIRTPMKLSIRSRQSRTPPEMEEAVEAPSMFPGSQKSETKILLLGIGQSSKSTLFKQMRYLYDDDFSKEMDSWRSEIWRNLGWAFKDIIRFMRYQFIEIKDDQCLRAMELIESEKRFDYDETLPLEFLSAFKTLRADQMFQLTLNSQNNYLLLPMIDYFLSDLDRLFTPGFSPTAQDIFHIRGETRGIYEHSLHVDSHIYRLFDVGGVRSERKKWIRVFDDVHIIVFSAAMSDYDLTLWENKRNNSIKESLTLFKVLSTTKWFKKTAIMLCFAKMDLFKKKVASGQRPIRDYFPEYDGEPTDVAAAQAFFTEKFKRVYRGNWDLSISYLNVTDTEDVRGLMEELKGVVSRFWRQEDYRQAIATS